MIPDGTASGSDEITGVVFNCESFSLHNGPGIRTTLFLKGCPLRCLWCANPESWYMAPEVSYNRELCIAACRECGKTAWTSPPARDPEGKIIIPGDIPRSDVSLISAARACPARALSVAGYTISASEAVKLLCRDRPFFEESGGGATLSGGEPLLQPSFTAEVLRGLKHEGIHTALDTCGDAETEIYAETSDFADLILFDFKAASDELHRKWTGRSNKQILANLKYGAAEHPQKLRIRIPYIPGLNAVESEMSAMAGILTDMGVSRVELLPYHRFGIHKYRQQGKKYSLTAVPLPDYDMLHNSARIFEDLGVEAVIQ